MSQLTTRLARSPSHSIKLKGSSIHTYESQNEENEEDLQGGRDASPSPSSARLRSNTSSIYTENTEKPRWKRHLLTLAWFIADQWFLVALGFLILLASQIQVPGSQQKKKEIVVTYLCVALIFFITGCTLPTNVLLQNYGRWKIHLFVQIQSFLLTSATVYAVVSLCATNQEFMDAGLLVGMIFSGAVPTTISSNVIMTKQANGNQALTVVQSTLGNFLGPFISPLLVLMYLQSGAWYTKVVPGIGSGGFGELYRRVFMQLGLSLFLPFVSAGSRSRDPPHWLTAVAGGWTSSTESLSECHEKDFCRLEAFQVRLVVTVDNRMANF